MYAIYEFDGISWKIYKSGFTSFDDAFSFMQSDSKACEWPNMYKVHEI